VVLQGIGRVKGDRREKEEGPVKRPNVFNIKNAPNIIFHIFPVNIK